jgi:hypothetical protein
MNSQQLSLFNEPSTEQNAIWTEINDLKSKQNNIRRGLFQRFEELQNEVQLLRNQIVIMIPKNKDY